MLKTLFYIVVSVYFSSITYNSNVYIVLYILFSIICAILISRIVSYRYGYDVNVFGNAEDALGELESNIKSLSKFSNSNISM